MSKEKKTRINLELHSGAKERLVKLQKKTEAASVTEVIRRSVVLYELVISNLSDDAVVIIKDVDGNEMRITKEMIGLV